MNKTLKQWQKKRDEYLMEELKHHWKRHYEINNNTSRHFNHQKLDEQNAHYENYQLLCRTIAELDKWFGDKKHAKLVLRGQFHEMFYEEYQRILEEREIE